MVEMKSLPLILLFLKPQMFRDARLGVNSIPLALTLNI
jgi:hypothetical protein